MDTVKALLAVVLGIAALWQLYQARQDELWPSPLIPLNQRPPLQSGYRLAALTGVMFLAVLADSPWVYGATLFVVASQATDKQYLERIAAILRGRNPEFWHHQDNIALRPEPVRETIERQATSDRDLEPGELEESEQAQIPSASGPAERASSETDASTQLKEAVSTDENYQVGPSPGTSSAADVEASPSRTPVTATSADERASGPRPDGGSSTEVEHAKGSPELPSGLESVSRWPKPVGPTAAFHAVVAQALARTFPAAAKISNNIIVYDESRGPLAAVDFVVHTSLGGRPAMLLVEARPAMDIDSAIKAIERARSAAAVVARSRTGNEPFILGAVALPASLAAASDLRWIQDVALLFINSRTGLVENAEPLRSHFGLPLRHAN